MTLSFIRAIVVTAALLTANAPVLRAERTSFAKERFSLEIPADWAKDESPADGAILHRDAPGEDGSFSVYLLPVKKDHRPDLKGMLGQRVKSIQKAGLRVSAEVEAHRQENFDGKPALFAVVPIETDYEDLVIKFTYYLVFIDAKDSVVILQAALPRPPGKKLQQDALGIIQSFRESE
ncbi:MAG: hypothetical protein CMO40_02470 [Verrucomicrobiaceae bacterium]|nr:hypothetical protein [Verrucomicrobiaceae bacterium]